MFLIDFNLKNGQLSTKIYDKRDDFNFKIINFPNMCSNIPASHAYGVYISQLIRYARASSNYSDFLKRRLRHNSTKLSEVNVKNIFTSHIDKKIFLTFLFLTTYLYTFSLYENPSLYVQQYTRFSCIWCLHLAIDSLCKGQ
jgi:hypothetical protein